MMNPFISFTLGVGMTFACGNSIARGDLKVAAMAGITAIGCYILAGSWMIRDAIIAKK